MSRNTMGAGFTILLAFIASALFKGWAFMLLIGAAHSYEPVIPALGFAASFGLSLAIQVAAYQYDAAKD